MSRDNQQTPNGRANGSRLIILTNVLILVVVGFLAYQLQQLSKRETQAASVASSEASARIDEIQRSLNVLVAGMQSKRMLSPELVESLVPGPLATFLAEARNLESVFTTDQLAEKREAISVVVNALPATRRDQLVDEIVEANWLIGAREILSAANPTETGDQVAEVSIIRALQSSAPPATAQALADKLEQRRKERVAALTEKLAKLQDDFGKDASAGGSLSSLALLAIAADAVGDEAKESQPALPGLILDLRRWNENADTLVKNGPATDAPVQLTRLEIAQDEGLQLQRQLVALDLPLPPNFDLPKKVLALQEKAAAVQRQVLGNYQKWALEQIAIVHGLGGEKAAKASKEALNLANEDPDKAVQAESFRNVMSGPAVRAKLRELTKVDIPEKDPLTATQAKSVYEALWGITGWTGNAELAQCLNRDLLEQKLLKIDESLLSTPVGKLYAEVFDTCWKYLEGTDHRVQVAKTATAVEKQKPEMPQ